MGWQPGLVSTFHLKYIWKYISNDDFGHSYVQAHEEKGLWTTFILTPNFLEWGRPQGNYLAQKLPSLYDIMFLPDSFLAMHTSECNHKVKGESSGSLNERVPIFWAWVIILVWEKLKNEQILSWAGPLWQSAYLSPLIKNNGWEIHEAVMAPRYLLLPPFAAYNFVLLAAVYPLESASCSDFSCHPLPEMHR